MESDEFEPGPGQYRYYKPESKSKGFTIGERFKETKKDYIPGPGEYRGLDEWAQGYGYSVKNSAKYVELVP